MPNHKKCRVCKPKKDANQVMADDFKKHSLLYEILMGIELVLYAGIVAFVLIKIVPSDIATFIGIIFAGMTGMAIWLVNKEICDYLVGVPIWIHMTIICLLTGIFILGRIFLTSITSVVNTLMHPFSTSPANGTNY
ncbi:MAG: hypothetical protein Q7S29_05430 [Candidatus Peribacter sp.]|nr:hypothetical protein [Candidatus Peribacter sp.]